MEQLDRSQLTVPNWSTPTRTRSPAASRDGASAIKQAHVTPCIPPLMWIRIHRAARLHDCPKPSNLVPPNSRSCRATRAAQRGPHRSKSGYP